MPGRPDPPTYRPFSALTDPTIAVTVSNVSPLDGEEVVLLYAVPVKRSAIVSVRAAVQAPHRLAVSVSASASAAVSFAVNASACVTVTCHSALVAAEVLCLWGRLATTDSKGTTVLFAAVR